MGVWRVAFVLFPLSWLAAGASAGAEKWQMNKVSHDANLGARVEIRGVKAGAFDPAIWQAGTLHWVFNEPSPILQPQEGKFRNIYAPSIIREKDGWRVFYGAWDGVDTANDRIYSRWTQDFIAFTDRRLLIDHGAFIHVCNCSAVRLPDGSYGLAATVWKDPKGLNKPAFFSSPDARVWNGSSPYQARLSDIVLVDGYSPYADADINGTNALLHEDGVYRLYFNDVRFGKILRASGKDGRTFTLDGASLSSGHGVNDVKKFVVGGRAWYLMALHMNTDTLWYCLSSDGLRFGDEREITRNRDADDRYMVAVGWVCDEARVYGVLYGAGAVGQLNENRIFAKWLQKRLVFQTADGSLGDEALASGPDRVRLPVPPEGSQGRFEVYAEDGQTLLHRGPEVTLRPGEIWELAGG